MNAETEGSPKTYNSIDPERVESEESFRSNDISIVVSKPKYMEVKNMWGTFPFWLLVTVQWILAFGVTVPVMIVLSLLWPIASLCYYDIAKTLGTDVQILLALMGTVFAVFAYPVVLALALIGGLIMWILWIARDIKAIRKNQERPCLLPEKYQGLYGFVH